MQQLGRLGCRDIERGSDHFECFGIAKAKLQQPLFVLGKIANFLNQRIDHVAVMPEIDGIGAIPVHEPTITICLFFSERVGPLECENKPAKLFG